jgi:hypothetical protein
VALLRSQSSRHRQGCARLLLLLLLLLEVCLAGGQRRQLALVLCTLLFKLGPAVPAQHGKVMA